MKVLIRDLKVGSTVQTRLGPGVVILNKPMTKKSVGFNRIGVCIEGKNHYVTDGSRWAVDVLD